MRKRYLATAALIVVIVILLFWFSGPRPGHVLDEASRAGLKADYFNSSAHVDVKHDYFHAMDGGIDLDKNEISGRNMWLLWTGGNDRFWDGFSAGSFGSLDFLKTLSSYDPARDTSVSDQKKKEELKTRYKATRDNRWAYLGLVNEPCFDKAVSPDENRFGLWLDKRRPDCPADPFEDETKYPGVKIGARGKNMPAGSYYGAATGIIGLRLFPNPEFDEAAAKKWDPVRYYTDESYYQSADLVKPYRVGMACAFCHVGPNPVRPPVDANAPEWANLSSNVGAQYFWVDRIFSWESAPKNFVYQLLHTQPPGSLDTSLISTDYINNPRTMNAVYNLGPRLELAKQTDWGKESLAGGGLDNRQFNDYVSSGPLTRFFKAPSTVWTPRVLKDGSDSVGALGALNRVYINIGLFSEEWLLHFRAMVGGKAATPIEISVAQKNSVYWQATVAQTPDMALFLLKGSAPHRLKDAPGASKYLTEAAATVNEGKLIFADYCARCHSSKLPKPPANSDPVNCGGKDYLECWNRYWTWTKTAEFKQQTRPMVLADDFLKDNVLSTDLRVPVTLLETNACSPLATNSIAGNIWDNFSSQTFKDLPSVGTITYYHPFTGEKRTFKMPAGGRGYTRPASLVSAWSTAPFLLANTVGEFQVSPSVDARMKSFENSITQMLWPERREQDRYLKNIPGKIARTDSPSYVRIPGGYLPAWVRALLKPGAWLFPWLFDKDGSETIVSIGPFPAGMPIGLISNLELALDGASFGEELKQDRVIAGVLLKQNVALKAVRARRDAAQGRDDALDISTVPEFSSPELVDAQLGASKCPDFVVNRGHYFGTSYFKEEPALSDAQKNALIAFLKTF